MKANALIYCLKYLIKLLLFWLIIFFVGRVIFIALLTNHIGDSDLGEVFMAFISGLRLDVSTACYLISIPVLLSFFYTLLPNKIIPKVLDVLIYLKIVLIWFIVVSEPELYKEWGSKLNYKALSYLQNPSEVLNSASTSYLLLGFSLIAILTAASIFSYHKWIRLNYSNEHKRFILMPILSLVFISGLLVVGMRGGIGGVPITQSDAYYSKNNFLNLAAVNSPWNLLHSISENNKYLDENPYIFFTPEKANEIVREIHKTESDSSISILKDKNVNVVLIILESWSADLVKSLGGFEETAPEVEKLISDGLLFTNCYSSGMRSDQGLAAILAGFPSQPSTSILMNPSKQTRLPCLANDFKKQNYETSFFYGSELFYGNIKGYVYSNEYDKIVERKDYPSNQNTGKLGVPDEFLFARCLSDSKEFKEPFFQTIFTASTHSPYDMPMEFVFDWKDEENPYINSGYYTDKCLGKYFEEAKKQSWFKNTLFVIVADHSHNSPRHWEYYSHQMKKIPLLFFGEPLKNEWKGKTFDKTCSQVDIPATLLSQLDMDFSSYKWSKDMFNVGYKPFAFVSPMNAYGWKTDSSYYSYSFNYNRFMIREFKNDSVVATEQAQAYLQLLFQEFLDY